MKIGTVMHGLIVMGMCATTPAGADVLEVNAGGSSWIAGGPATPDSSMSSSKAASPYLTHVGTAAGPVDWRIFIAQLSAKYELSPALLEAVVWQESRWNSNALSPAGARGLAQLMPDTARYLGVNPHDPPSNLEGGARYLRILLNMFDGDLEKALAAYNAGPMRVRKAGGIPAIRETRDYVAAIMSRLAQPVRR